jgi:hypothetical protein
MRTLIRVAAVTMAIGMLAVIAACSGPPKNSALAEQCENGLKTAYQELDFAKAKGFGGSVDWTKAASLLSAASIQQEFGKYPNCVDKVQRARYYIEQSKK